MDSGLKKGVAPKKPAGISIIVALDDTGAIGKNGEIPWKLQRDMKQFKLLTTGHAVIMGRKTYENIIRRLGCPLPERKNVVLTRDLNFRAADGVQVVHSFDEALAIAENELKEVFVIGGAEIYKLALPYTNRLYITEVHTEIAGADTFFPPNELLNWIFSGETKVFPADEENEFPYSFVVYSRKQEHVRPFPASNCPTVAESYVKVGHARCESERQVLKDIEKLGVCPFCPEEFRKFHDKPILLDGDWWLATENQWPYEGAKLAFLFIHKTHIESVTELSLEAWAELLDQIKKICHAYRIESGAIGIRFGSGGNNGSSVRHQHVHLLVADPKAAESLKFRMCDKKQPYS